MREAYVVSVTNSTDGLEKTFVALSFNTAYQLFKAEIGTLFLDILPDSPLDRNGNLDVVQGLAEFNWCSICERTGEDISKTARDLTEQSLEELGGAIFFEMPTISIGLEKTRIYE